MMSIFSMIDDLQKKKKKYYPRVYINFITNKVVKIRNMTNEGHMEILIEGHGEEDFDESFLSRLRP